MRRQVRPASGHLDALAGNRDVCENRRSRIVVIEEIVMDRLVVPHAPAGHRVDAHDRVAEQIIAFAMAAVHVVRDAGRWQVHVTKLFVGTHQRPDIAGAGVPPRLVFPALAAVLTVARDDMKRPPQLAGMDVVFRGLACT